MLPVEHCSSIAVRWVTDNTTEIKRMKVCHTLWLAFFVPMVLITFQSYPGLLLHAFCSFSLEAR